MFGENFLPTKQITQNIYKDDRDDQLTASICMRSWTALSAARRLASFFVRPAAVAIGIVSLFTHTEATNLYNKYGPYKVQG